MTVKALLRSNLLEIVGCPVAFGHYTNANTQWATSVSTGLRFYSPGQTKSYNIDQAETDLGGTSVWVRDIAELLNTRKAGGRALLTQTASKTDNTLYVSDGGLFPAPAFAWLGSECVYVTATSPTSLTVNRAQLGTKAARHLKGKTVYNFMPNFVGRMVRFVWQNPNDPTEEEVRYLGVIAGAPRSEDGYSLKIVSFLSLFRNRKVLGGQWARGKLALGLDKDTLSTTLFVQLANKEVPFPDHSPLGHGRAHLKIGSEIIEYLGIRHPLTSSEVSATTGNDFEFKVTTLADFGVDTVFDLEDHVTGNVLAGGAGLRVTNITEPVPNIFLISHSGRVSPSVGNFLRAVYHQTILPFGMRRGAVGTSRLNHEIGTEVSEVRVLQGNHTQILFWLLFSEEGDGTAGPDGGVWDVLPEGWGLGLHPDFVDVESFKANLKATGRLYRFTESLSLSDLIRWYARTSGSTVFWSSTGVLTCRNRLGVYPRRGADHNIQDAVEKTKPLMEYDESRIVNYAEVQGDFDTEGNPGSVLRVVNRESQDLFGRRELPQIEDPGIVEQSASTILQEVLRQHLLMRGSPVGIVQIRVPLDLDAVYELGDTVSLTQSHLPNGEGGTGFENQTFEILSIRPNDPAGEVELILMRREASDSLCLIAPSMVVESIVGAVVTVRSSSWTHYSSSQPFVEPYSGRSGQEDIDWFLDDDLVRFWDESQLGVAPAQSHPSQVTGINYAARTVTFTSIPAWLSPGDTIFHDEHTTVSGGVNAAEREDFAFFDIGKKWGI